MNYINDPNYQTILRRRRSRRRRHNTMHKLLKALIFLVIVLIIGVGGFFIVKAVKTHKNSPQNPGQSAVSPSDETPPKVPDIPVSDPSESNSETPDSSSDAPSSDSLEALLLQADRLAAGYNYDGAIALLSGNAAYAGTQEVADAIAGYEAVKATLVEADVNQITHVFSIL